MSSPKKNDRVKRFEADKYLTVAKRLPLQDEDFIQKLRIGYVSAQIVSIAIYFFIMQKVGASAVLPCTGSVSES